MPLKNHAKIEGEPVLPFDNKLIGAVEVLTIFEAASFFKLSVTSMRRLQQQRLIPFTKVGGSVRFFKSDLLAYMEQRRVKPIDQ